MIRDILVLHYQDGSSDKIWAINKIKNADNTYDVWYGRKGNKLKHVKLGNMSWHERVEQKLSKGYREMDTAIIDVESSMLVPNLEETEIPTSLWYQVSDQVPVDAIRDYLNTTTSLLSESFVSELESLKGLPTYQNLYEGNKKGGTEYQEGPLAVLLLFGLRRYLMEFTNPDASVCLLQLVDDSNQHLPPRFEAMGEYIEKFCISLFAKNGWYAESDSDQNNLTEFIAKQQGLEHYLSIVSIKPLAIAMGCIDMPIDLSVINTETKAAFF